MHTLQVKSQAALIAIGLSAETTSRERLVRRVFPNCDEKNKTSVKIHRSKEIVEKTNKLNNSYVLKQIIDRAYDDRINNLLKNNRVLF